MKLTITSVVGPAHASASPHLGRSALDAVELMNVGINYMREHMPSSARIHYAVTDTGGHSSHVVHARATVRYLIRVRELPALQQLVKRVDNIAAGAALMSETTVTSQVLSGDANLIGNSPAGRAHAGASGIDCWNRRLSLKRSAIMPRVSSRPSVRTIEKRL